MLHGHWKKNLKQILFCADRPVVQMKSDDVIRFHPQAFGSLHFGCRLESKRVVCERMIGFKRIGRV